MAAPSRSPTPPRFPLHGLQFCPRVCFCLRSAWAAASLNPDASALPWGPPWPAVQISVMVHHGLQGHSLLHHGPLYRLQEHLQFRTECFKCFLLLQLPWFLQSCFTFSHSFFLAAIAMLFLPFLKYDITEDQLVFLISADLASSRSSRSNQLALT